jgi:hypothetical protein
VQNYYARQDDEHTCLSLASHRRQLSKSCLEQTYLGLQKLRDRTNYNNSGRNAFLFILFVCNAKFFCTALASCYFLRWKYRSECVRFSWKVDLVLDRSAVVFPCLSMLWCFVNSIVRWLWSIRLLSVSGG